MARNINAATLALIKQWEGLRLDAYQDVAGVWTIGYGHTGPEVGAGQRIDEAAAETILRRDLQRFEDAVDRLVTAALNDNQFGALVSFAFNVGERALETSTLLRKLNAGDYDAVPVELVKWNRAGGKVVTGLINRRAAEVGLWAKGSFVSSNTAPVAPPVDPARGQINVTTVATAAATAAPALSALGAIPQWVGVAVVAAVGLVVLAVILSNRRHA